MGSARRDAPVRVSRQPSNSASAPGPFGPYHLPGPSCFSTARGGGSGGLLSRRADPPPRPACGQHLSGLEEGGRRIHPGRRGDPGPVRLAGGAGFVQRAQIPRRAAGPHRSGDPDRHLPGGGDRLGREDGHVDFVQPGSPKDRRRFAQSGPIARGTPPDPDLSAGRRPRGLPGTGLGGPGAERLRDGAGRGDRHAGARRTVGYGSAQCDADPLGGDRRGGIGG